MSTSSGRHVRRLTLFCAALLCVITQGASAAREPAAATLTLESDRTVRVRILAALTSTSAHEGQQFGVTTIDDVYVGDQIVLPKYSIGRGEVVSVRRARIFWLRGRLRVAINGVVAPDGSTVPVVLPYDIAGLYDASRIHHGWLGFFGDDVVIPCGAIATVLIAQDTTLRGYGKDELPARSRPPSCPHAK